MEADAKHLLFNVSSAQIFLDLLDSYKMPQVYV